MEKNEANNSDMKRAQENDLDESSNVLISEQGMGNEEEEYPRVPNIYMITDDLRIPKRQIPYVKPREIGDGSKREEKKESPDEEDERGMYKDRDLYLAAINGDLANFKRVLNRVSKGDSAAYIDILSRLSPTRNTFLHVAAKNRNEEIVAFVATTNRSLLLAKNLIGDTALHVAAKAGDESMVNALVRIHGENDLLMAENGMRNTALHEALFSGWDSIATYLIQQCPHLSYHLNSNGESALYLAAKAGLLDCVSSILAVCTDERRLNELFSNKSPIQAAIETKHTDVLEAMFNANPRLIQMRDSEGRNPLHFAASLGHLQEARYLLQKYPLNATQIEKHGALPIHLAASEGHVDIISLLLEEFPDAGELLDVSGCNILHVAAKRGRYNVFTFVLKNPRFNYLINMKDKFGNTPLHWASSQFHPKIVYTLTWDKRVDIKAVNNDGMTALDFAEFKMPVNPQLRQRLTWSALKAASPARQSSNRKASGRIKSANMENYKERVNTLMLVATLVATVTFAAGFTMPGGYNSSDSDNADMGMATMWRHRGFDVFVLCDTIAMYSSIIVATALIWAQLGDLTLAITALKLAAPLLGVALIMMSMAFTAGVVIVVAKLRWLQIAVLSMATSFIVFLLLLLIPLCAPISSRNRILRYLSYYPFYLLILVTYT